MSKNSDLTRRALNYGSLSIIAGIITFILFGFTIEFLGFPNTPVLFYELSNGGTFTNVVGPLNWLISGFLISLGILTVISGLLTFIDITTPAIMCLKFISRLTGEK